MNGRRVLAVFRRHVYATIQSPPRLAYGVFWPATDLLLWGLVSAYLQRAGPDLPVPATFLLGGLLLWHIVFWAKNTVALTFLEEGFWRNVVNLLATPLTPGEYLAGALAFSVAKVGLSWVLVSVLSWGLFSFGVLELGPVLGVYGAILLLFGVALALLVLGLVFLLGREADELAWATAAMVLPFAAVFYPVGSLPGWAQGVAAWIPAAHVFESLRMRLSGDPTGWGSLATAALLDGLFLAVGFLFARAMLVRFRRRGHITRYM